ncbi:MAG: hypothetical protein CVU42_04765 [Chloroflexi bacterium HGW-Chloroflexi-4]|jgi:hypothetical protein|nr:MAG: hypothetical protein CVU42_04765 [Chloroflexi bacterium HGW-Chloroflexi-4]
MTTFRNLAYGELLKEIRCEKDSQHRIEAAKYLLKDTDNSESIAYLINCVLYDSMPEVRKQVKALLFDVYGNELETILKVEGMDGIPIEDPWMIPCSLVKDDPWKNPDPIMNENRIISNKIPFYEDIDTFSAEKDVDGLHDALRDPLDINYRMSAINALLTCNNEGSPEMLARAVLHDPDENVQQLAYQALYKMIGDEKAESLLEKIGALIMDEDEEWLLVPDYFDEYKHALENANQEVSPFGINKADQIRGLINLFTGESNPHKRIKIINTLAESTDFNVNDAIARVGLFDEDKHVREHAKSVLESRLGENLDEFLEHVYNTASPFIADPENECEEEELEELNQIEKNNDFSARLNTQEPVVSEGSAINPLIIVAGLVILGMVLYLVMR